MFVVGGVSVGISDKQTGKENKGLNGTNIR